MLRLGDFTGLADNYAKYRPGYSSQVLNAMLGLFKNPVSALDTADVGAGTGIWSTMLYNEGPRSVTAVEPNNHMREQGIRQCANTTINWLAGSAESIPVRDNSFDWVTMASSFHWVDFDVATAEFHRVLRPGGKFTALWNSRVIESNPLFVEIENYIDELMPNLKRNSSGRSAKIEGLMSRLSLSPYFQEAVYIDAYHQMEMSPEHYLGAWMSVNDIRVQLGPLKFDKLIRFIKARVVYETHIVATYQTRSWTLQKK